MALPIQAESQIFSQDQTIQFKAYYWPTTSTAIRLGPAHPEAERYTAFGSGIEFGLFDLLDSAFAPTSKAALDAALTSGSASTHSVLGYDAEGNPRTGVIQTIYQYWGAGAPTGATRAKQALLHFRGVVTTDVVSAILLFGGQGTVQVYLTKAADQSVTQVVAGTMKEPSPTATLVGWTQDMITSEWGYAYNADPVALAAGDVVDIYYWHNGEPWGGIVGKLITGAIGANGETVLQQIRDASIIGTSLIAKEASALPAVVLHDVRSATLKVQPNTIATLDLEVALTPIGEPMGWHLEELQDEKRLRDNITPSNVLQKSRVLHFEGGFVRPDGTEELYPRFTGYINDIIPDPSGHTAIISCQGFEGKLAEPFDENNPDRLSYIANAYILRNQAAEPVFPIPAYDNWPLEQALLDLCYRAGIDPYTMGRVLGSNTTPNWALRRYVDTTTQTDYWGRPLFAARMLALDAPVALERQANYGNVAPLEKDFLPKDDPYLFAPQVTQRLWDRVKSLTEHYGYDFYFNGEGRAVLAGRNNPSFFQYMTADGPYMTGVDTPAVAVSAVGGAVFERTLADGAWTRVITGHFSRLDLFMGIGRRGSVNGGKIQVQVDVSDGSGGYISYAAGTITTWADTDEAYYYDQIVRGDGTNAAVISLLALPFDHYRVTLSPAGPDQGDADCLYRLNGVAVYERNPEQSYYADSEGNIQVFTTLGNLTKISPTSNMKDLRNHVLVVGSRKAAVTDSAKLDATANPNNPEQEFNVSVAVDPFSIYDPTSPNFVGGKRTAVIFDDKISDTDFARWVAQTLLLRQRQPATSAKFTHTVVPVLEFRDAIYVVEERNRSVQRLLWVTNITESWTPESATVDADTAGSPEIPSYQPREDVDIDTLFRRDAADDRSGVPVIDVEVSYKNLYGQDVSNVDLWDAPTITAFATKTPGKTGAAAKPMTSEVIASGASMTLSHVAIPETMYLAWHVDATSNTGIQNGIVKGYTLTAKRALVNNPYRHFFYIDQWNGSHWPTLQFTFEEGDGTAGVYDKSYYGFPSANDWSVCYDYLTERFQADGTTAAQNPFYDPYTSELGNLITLSFTQLVSGRVRVSVWDAVKGGQQVPVAWLTAPEATSDQPDAHWSYFDSGKRSFTWDASDNIGFYNTLNSLDLAEELKGAFGDKPMTVGKGFYVWNNKTTNPHTCIGDTDADNFGVDDAPYFTIGQFGQFYVKIEVLNDTLARKDMLATGDMTPRTVDSTDLPNSPIWNSTAETYIWTHLGEPNQVAIRIQDWVGAGTWTTGSATIDADWGAYSTPDADGSIRDGKPVRITFVPRARKGKMFEKADRSLDAQWTSGKLTRQVHCKATIWDQFWYFAGKPWQDFNTTWQQFVGPTENKRLQSRMFHNEDNTLEWEDGDYRTGNDLAAFEWIFDPSLFQKDFGTGTKERLRYGDYEQLESLPGFDPKDLGGTALGVRSYLTMAFINYLFYFSAFVLDRSGRRQWCLNSWTDTNAQQRGFIDRTKIVSPNWIAATDDSSGGANYRPYAIVDYAQHGADRYLARSIFVRQWKEPGWADGSYSGSPVTQYNITTTHQLGMVQAPSLSFDPQTTPFVDAVYALPDFWLNESGNAGTGVSQNARRQGHLGGEGDSVPAVFDLGVSVYQAPSSFGTWTFDRPGVTGFFTPNPCRDFHPFWRLPFMPDAAVAQTWPFTTSDFASGTSALRFWATTTSQINYPLRDIAVQEQWYGYSFSDAYAQTIYNARSGFPESRRRWFYGPRLEKTVEEFGATAATDGRGRNWDDDTISADRIAAMFDYARSDDMDRWDQFRGAITRGPYPDRKADDTTWYDDVKKKRVASPQPIKASGTYLLNLGRYSGYDIAPIHPNLPLYVTHFTYCTDWFDIRFSAEYVWYSPRYFPTTASGGAVYMYTQDEYTKVSGWVGSPWWAQRQGSLGNVIVLPFFPFPFGDPGALGGTFFDPTHPYFDPGAWTGWKPDATVSDWTSSPHLRWSDVDTTTYDSVTLDKAESCTGGSGPLWSSVPTGTAEQTYLDVFYHPNAKRWKRTNVFDEHFSKKDRMRLAVGREIPEARGLVMNLCLPERLRG